jgi:hypothetical protein
MAPSLTLTVSEGLDSPEWMLVNRMVAGGHIYLTAPEAIRGQDGWVLSRCLPRELRIKLYDDVVALRRGGLMYRGIIGEVWRRYGVRIS